jgi:hypothetical protein
MWKIFPRSNFFFVLKSLRRVQICYKQPYCSKGYSSSLLNPPDFENILNFTDTSCLISACKTFIRYQTIMTSRPKMSKVSGKFFWRGNCSKLINPLVFGYIHNFRGTSCLALVFLIFVRLCKISNYIKKLI